MRFPGWVKGRGVMRLHLSEPRVMPSAAWVAILDGAGWSAKLTKKHSRPFAAGLDVGPDGADACESALRAAGVLAPDAVVWRPPELRAPVWLTQYAGMTQTWESEAKARKNAGPGVRLLRAVEVSDE